MQIEAKDEKLIDLKKLCELLCQYISTWRCIFRGSFNSLHRTKGKMIKLQIPTVEDIPKVAVEFIDEVGHRKIFAFDAEMGTGKTTFLKKKVDRLSKWLSLSLF